MIKELLSKLDQFPHVQSKLTILWGSPECRAYLVDLETPDRIGRQGFPFDVLMTLHQLKDHHDQTYPQFAPAPKPWDHEVKRG